MSLGLCPTKLPVAWEEGTDLFLSNRSGPCADQISKSQAPELARLEQEFFAYNICTCDGCECCAIMSVAVHVAVLCEHVCLCRDVQHVSLCGDVQHVNL